MGDERVLGSKDVWHGTSGCAHYSRAHSCRGFVNTHYQADSPGTILWLDDLAVNRVFYS